MVKPAAEPPRVACIGEGWGILPPGGLRGPCPIPIPHPPPRGLQVHILGRWGQGQLACVSVTAGTKGRLPSRPSPLLV